MPLRCVDDKGVSFQSHMLDEQQWAALKAAHAQRRHLRMPCCLEVAILKTSPLGTHFFAHQRRGDCASKPESAEHLMLKSLVAQAIAQCGWTVATEVRGKTDEGEEWIADVLASRGKARVAVEIQLSRQTDSDTYARQARYQQSGIRGLWLFKQSDFPVDERVPAVHVCQDDSGQFKAVIMGNDHSPSLSVPDFIQHAFKGRFWFGTFRPNTTVTATMLGGFVKCWKCSEWTNVVSDVTVQAMADEQWPLSVPLHELPKVPTLMQQLPLAQGIPQQKVGKILIRYSKTEGGNYLANSCVNCNALQGKFFLSEIAHRLKPVFSTTVLVSDDLERSLREFDSDLCCWRLEVPDSPASPDGGSHEGMVKRPAL